MIFPHDRKSLAIAVLLDFSRKKWQRGRSLQKIAEICDCEFRCSQTHTGLRTSGGLVISNFGPPPATRENLLNLAFLSAFLGNYRQRAQKPRSLVNPLLLKKIQKTGLAKFLGVGVGVRNRHFVWVGRTPKGAYSTRGRSRHLLETSFSEPLLRTLLRTVFYCKTHRRPPSQNPSENPFPRTLPRTFSEPFSERCVAVRPVRRAPYWGTRGQPQEPFWGYFWPQ